MRLAAPEAEAAEAAQFDRLSPVQRLSTTLPNTVSTTTSARLFVSPATSATSLMSAAFVRLPSVTGSSFVQGSAVTATGARLLPLGGNPWAQ